MRTSVISGVVLASDGKPAQGGTVSVSLSRMGRIGDAIVCGSCESEIGMRGVLCMRLAPNAAIEPKGTSYAARFSAGGRKWNETIAVPDVETLTMDELEVAGR